MQHYRYTAYYPSPPKKNQKKNKWDVNDILRMLFIAGLFIATMMLIAFLSNVLIPFAIALVLAYLINPLVDFFNGFIKHRPFAVIVSLFLVFCCFTSIFFTVIPLVSAEVKQTSRLITDLMHNSEFAARASKHLPDNLWQAVKGLTQRPEVQEVFKSGDILVFTENILKKLVPGAWGILKGAVGVTAGLAGLVVIGLYTVFLLIDFQKVRTGWLGIIPPAQRELIDGLATDFMLAMNRYFRAQALVAGVTGVLFAICFGLMGLPLGILFGLFAGMLNIVPYLQLLALVPAVFLGAAHSLETGMNLWLVYAIILAIFGVVQLIQDSFIVPRFMGQATGLSPAVILLCLAVWGKLLGMLGLILAIPFTCLLLAWYRRFVLKEE